MGCCHCFLHSTSIELTLVFAVVSASNNDRAILVDSVLIVAAGAPLATSGSVAVGTSAFRIASNFGSPSLNGSTYGPAVTIQPYVYNAPISNSQPWTFTLQQGGIATTGSAFDPPQPSTPPTGNQYAFLQTSPNGALYDGSSSMSTTLTGLTGTNPYWLSFYWAARLASGGSATQSQLSVSVNGVQVYLSTANLTDSAGWKQVNTSRWSMTSGSATAQIVFTVVSLSNNDHSILIDGINLYNFLQPGSSSSSSSSGAATGSSSTTTSSSSSGLSGGAIAGIVIGCVVGGLLCYSCLLFLCFLTQKEAQTWT